jgi:hypothetical protein
MRDISDFNLFFKSFKTFVLSRPLSVMSPRERFSRRSHLLTSSWFTTEFIDCAKMLNSFTKFDISLTSCWFTTEFDCATLLNSSMEFDSVTKLNSSPEFDCTMELLLTDAVSDEVVFSNMSCSLRYQMKLETPFNSVLQSPWRHFKIFDKVPYELCCLMRCLLSWMIDV